MKRATIESLPARRLLSVATSGAIGTADYVVTDRQKLIITLSAASTLAIHGAVGRPGNSVTVRITEIGDPSTLAVAHFTRVKSIQIEGSDGGDRVLLTGNMRTLTARLNAGDDRFEAPYQMFGPEAVFGGAGNDRILGDVVPSAGQPTNRRFPFTFYGDVGNDTLHGAGQADLLVGGDGDDRLVGSNGNNTLLGGGGRDTLYGGANTDTFDGGSSADVIEYQSKDILAPDADDHLRLLA